MAAARVSALPRFWALLACCVVAPLAALNIKGFDAVVDRYADVDLTNSDGQENAAGLVVMSRVPFPKSLGQCALVGSAKSLVGKRRGQTIDQHPVVLRVGRLPTEDYARDFGAKTDVYFGGCLWLQPSGVQVHYLSPVFGGKLQACNHTTAAAPAQTRCPFSALVLRPYSPSGVPPWDCPGKALAADAVMPVAFEGAASLEAARALLNHTTLKPTSGFLSMVVAAQLCDRLRLFGFSGAGTADGHPEGHQTMEQEHEWYRLLASGRPGALPQSRPAAQPLLQRLFALSERGAFEVDMD